jgi:hypothetical protein
MSDRERWIIYPLLFFALALAARGQTSRLPTVGRFRTIVCRDLRIVSQGTSGSDAKLITLSGAGNGQNLVLQFDGNRRLQLSPRQVVRPSRVVVKSVEPETVADPKKEDKDEPGTTVPKSDTPSPDEAETDS